MKSILKIVIIFLIFLSSCKSDNERNEILNSYNISIEILKNSIERTGLYIVKNHLYNPAKMSYYYNNWLILDSLKAEIYLFLEDSVITKDSICNFYIKQKEIINNIDSVFLGDVKFIDKLEISESKYPKLITAITLLNNIDNISHKLLDNIIFTTDNWMVNWNFKANRNDDTTTLNFESDNFYKLLDDGYVKIDKIKDSKGNLIKRFKTTTDYVILKIQFADKNDSIYYISGSIYAFDKQMNNIRKVEKFDDKKIKIAPKP